MLCGRFNREGDLLISCAKDLSASLWRSEDGLRLGTFEGHKGTIWTCDITCELLFSKWSRACRFGR